MRCSKCGVDNRQGRKFCAECAAPLVLTCAKCGADNQPGEKFCGECAAALNSPDADWAQSSSTSWSGPSIRVTSGSPETLAKASELNGERKTVTALFADIKGSMELIEDLDPEEARVIVDPALKLMIDAVHRYDGYIVQSTGDGIFALFGAPVGHEDHAQRALYAALRMQDDMRRLAERLRAEKGINLQVRVGANIGEVVVRSIQTGEGQPEYTPIGHSMSLASRLQALANPGSIAISDGLHKHVEGYFTLKALGPARVKGSSEPVNVYEVLGLGPLRTRLQRAAGRGLTKFVGRAREMEALKRAAEQAQTGHGQVVAVMADPGVGKTRLFYEFKATSALGWMALEALSISHGKASAYLPVIDLLRNYFEISAADDEGKRREKVADKIAMLDRSLEDTLPYIFSLLGIVEGDDPLAQTDGQIKKRRTLEAIKRILLRESLKQPLMVMFEDLHWMDGESEGLLNLLADSIGSSRVLLLVSYRPEYSHRWGNKTYYAQLRLDPLGKDSSQEMLSALLGDGKDLVPLKRVIIERTEGTPFFIEEMVQTLFEDGVIQRNGVVKLVRSMNTVKVPTTVQAVLASRIDRLPAKEKELLQTLALLGRRFALGLVQRLMQQSDDELEPMLSRLQAGEFIYEQLSAEDMEYVFKHTLTQEVAYSGLLVERRKLLHERAGVALESMFAGQLDEHLLELAHHYSRTDNVNKAIEYLERAGQQALHRSAHADAISNLGAGLILVQKLPDSPERIRRELVLQLAIGPALMVVKGFGAPEVEGAYSRARDLCERLGDPQTVFPALLGLWLTYLTRAGLQKAREVAEQLVKVVQTAHHPVPLIYAEMALAVTLYWMGDFLPVRERLENAIGLYDPERHGPLIFGYYGTADARVSCLSYAAWNLWQLGHPDQALKKGDEALVLAQELSHPHSLALAHFFSGVLRQLRRETRAAQEFAESVIVLSAEREISTYLAFATSLRGWALAKQGRNEEGVAQMRDGLAALSATGAELLRPYFLCLLAESWMETASFDEGLGALTEAFSIADEHEDRSYEAETHRLKGELLLKQKDSNAVDARSCFQRAIAIATGQGAKSFELRATISLARLLASQGHRDKARVMLAEIYNRFTEGFDTADLKDARALLDELTA